MKVNIAMRLASILLMCTIATSIWTGSTLAKYSSTATGSDTATVAKWNVIIDGTSFDSVTETNMSIFGQAYDIETKTEEYIRQSSLYGGDLGGDWEKVSIVAPGTIGVADLVITNSSDVTASINVSFEEVLGGYILSAYSSSDVRLPFLYYVGTESVNSIETAADIPTSNWCNEISEVNSALSTIRLAAGASTTIRIFWQWPFYVSDAQNSTDTSLTAKEMELKATVTATQVD